MKKVKVIKKRFMGKPVILNGTLLSNINEYDENIIGARNYYKIAVIRLDTGEVIKIKDKYGKPFFRKYEYQVV